MNIYSCIHLFHFEGIPVRINRVSAFLCVLLLLLSVIIGPSFLIVYLCILFVMFIHEAGHALVAKRFGCDVYEIRLYLFHGKCIFSDPYTEYEQVLIIWGGPLAQLMLLLLSSVILFAYGYSPYSFYNIMLVIFVYYNFANVLFNLMPISWLDGGTAWKIIPMLIKKRS